MIIRGGSRGPCPKIWTCQDASIVLSDDSGRDGEGSINCVCEILMTRTCPLNQFVSMETTMLLKVPASTMILSLPCLHVFVSMNMCINARKAHIPFSFLQLGYVIYRRVLRYYSWEEDGLGKLVLMSNQNLVLFFFGPHIPPLTFHFVVCFRYEESII